MKNPFLVVAGFTPFCLLALAIGPPASVSTASNPHGVTNAVPESCPITKPPAQSFVPPPPYPQKIGPDGFWIGTNQLWIGLPKNGRWQNLPRWRDGSLGQKLFWWHEVYSWRREHERPLKVTGVRLDAAAPPMQSEVSNGRTKDSGHPFITGINLPSVGCWKITGRYQDAEVSFVVWVTDLQAN